MSYRAPVSEYQFLLQQILGYEQITATERFAEADNDLMAAILKEAGKMCDEVMAPLQRGGDLEPARLENGVLRTSPGFGDGYKAIAEGGWIGMSADPEYGGMGLPMSLTTSVNEMMSGACLSLQLAPLMSQGQIEALEHHASDALKALYLPKLISGEWAGTMNLTESQAGSDVGALSSKAEDNGDGTYAVSGQKIYISWGDNDFTENVCHLVLARLPDGVPGTKGISLFLVPKYLPDENGNPGKANSLKVVSLEHKMGLHGSPTCVMQYDGATGWLVGKEHGGNVHDDEQRPSWCGWSGCWRSRRGLSARAGLCAGSQAGQDPGRGRYGNHCRPRRCAPDADGDEGGCLCIARDHAGLCGGHRYGHRHRRRRMENPRGFPDTHCQSLWHRDRHPCVRAGRAGAWRYGLYRGNRCSAVLPRRAGDGDMAHRLIDEIEEQAERARPTHPNMAEAVWQACETLREATEWLVDADMQDRFAGAVPYLMAFARVLGGHYHLAAALADKGGAREKLARFYIKRMLPQHAAYLTHAREGAAGAFALTAEELAS